MSKVIFKASKYLSDDELNAEMYLTDKDTRSWVDYCDGKFTPLWDLTEDMENAIYIYYKIDIPPIYEVLDRTGCMGCPYGKSVEKDLQLLSDNQYNYVLKLFKQSYDVRGINYERTN